MGSSFFYANITYIVIPGRDLGIFFPIELQSSRDPRVTPVGDSEDL